MTVHQQNKAEFLDFIFRVLLVIEQNDPRRFRSLQRELKFIANSPLLSAGNYDHFQRCCHLDFSKDRCSPHHADYDWHLALAASTVIHELTHTRLHSFGISYNNQT